MIFSSPIFLFGFFPIALLVYYLSPKILKNMSLLILSLCFYAWGEIFYILIMIVSILANYLIGIQIGKTINDDQINRVFLIIGIVINVLLLISFKYLNLIAESLNTFFYLVNISVFLDIEKIHLPLGISFFTFQAISYIVDVYRKEVPAQKNIINLALYISLFPQLIAGPIVRYKQIAQQIMRRKHSVSLFSSGVEKFIYGLAKKILIADSVAVIADGVFSIHDQNLTPQLAWIGIIAFSIQIYFDFSGYSDMAIGLGRMFGFRFLENFNYPYISTSLREFWTRWHISLSSWFRDYVYISLGGSRVSTLKTYFNLMTVFVLTGIWHGASWNFLSWGLFHGFFIASEHYGFTKQLLKLWKPIQHLYLLLIVIVGWVFFVKDSLSQAIFYIRTMFNITNDKETTAYQLYTILSFEGVVALLIGIVFSMPIFTLKLRQIIISDSQSNYFFCSANVLKLVSLSILLFLSVIKIASSTFSPFIYFRF